MWGRAVVHTDTETKRRLWTGVFDYDLNIFAPDGPEGASSGFIQVVPERAVFLKAYGSQGVFRWKA